MNYEYEERALLEEEKFFAIKNKLDNSSAKRSIGNKQSFFFVLPDVNVSIADNPRETVIKYKGGQLGKGNGFREIELPIERNSLKEALDLFENLLEVEPQESFQFRIDYQLEDSVNIALKYTDMWGFHIEVEYVYQASAIDKQKMSLIGKKKLDKVAEYLGITYISGDKMAKFKEQCAKNIKRGQYSPEVFKFKYGKLFGF